MDEITSPANPRVKWLVGMRKRSSRDNEGVTLVEGYPEIALAVETGVVVSAVYWCPQLVTDQGRLSLLDRLAGSGTDVVQLSVAAFARASYRESPDGWLAVVPSPGRPLEALTLGERPLVIVAESIEKPGNLGAMLRTADAAGVDAVVAASPVTDWGNPNVVRASKGTVFAVPVASATTESTMTWLRDRGLTTVVATPDAETLITEVDLTRGVAIVVGAEHSGVSDAWLGAADVAAAIPMSGRVNSLNVATSAAIVVYEAVRQRALVVDRAGGD
jgi:TrmH family RNA methyltransferase